MVSAGFPTVYAANKPVVVRLGGDFLWEKAFNNGWTSVGLEKYYSESKNFKEKIFLYIYKYVLKKSAKIIFSTDWQKNILCEVFNIKDKSVVIENAFTKNTVLKNHIKAEKNNEILYAGRLVRLKNLKTLLEAIKLDSELGLHIIGKGPEKNNLVGLVKELGVTGQVRFSDAKDHNDLQKTISSARVVVVPSVSDVSPQIIYESISLGIPVVATKSCGYFEKLKNNVRFVDSFDKNALAAALKNPNNNLNINISHNWNILVDEHEKVFKELV